MKIYILAYSLLAVVLSFISFSAFAASDNYPAAMCIKWNSGQPTPALSYSRIFNNSTARMYVDCPAVRKDFDSFAHWSAIESSWISAIDRNPSDSVCSRIIKYRHTGFTSRAIGSSTGRRCTTINSSATSPYAQKLSQGSLSLGHADYHLYLSVSIPGRSSSGSSGLVTYNVRQ